jgi:hypothetical protein
MNNNQEVPKHQTIQSSAANNPSVAEGERTPHESPRTPVSKATKQTSVKNGVLALGITLNDLTLIEKDKELYLNELDLHEVRTRNQKTIDDYIIRRKTSMPPNVIVFKIKNRPSLKLVVVDGVTRCIAAIQDGAETIVGDVYEATWEQAEILALKLNRHGEKIPTSDIKRRINELDEEYKDNPLSSREMGELVGYSHTAVAMHRATREQSTFEKIKSARRSKTPDEKRAALVKSVQRMVGEQGVEVLDDIVAALPATFHKAFVSRLVGE